MVFLYTEAQLMSTTPLPDARLNIRLAPDLKKTIEESAAICGQSLTDFATATLVERARELLNQAQVTELSNRDRDLFLDAIDGEAEPNGALKAAADRYRQSQSR